MKNKAAVELGRRGGKARAKSLTPDQRKKSARKAARSRWAKKSTGRDEKDTRQILKQA